MGHTVEEIVIDLPLRFITYDERFTFELDSPKPESIVTRLNDITLIFDPDTFQESPEGYLSREAELLSRYKDTLNPYVADCISNFCDVARVTSDMDRMLLFVSEQDTKIGLFIARAKYSVKQLPRLTTLKKEIIKNINSCSLGCAVYDALYAAFDAGNAMFNAINKYHADSLSSEAVSNARECMRLTVDISHLYSIMAGNMKKRNEESYHLLHIIYPGSRDLPVLPGATPKSL